MKNIKELNKLELKYVNGGTVDPHDFAYGIVSGLAFMYGGVLGWAYTTYNYVKD